MFFICVYNIRVNEMPRWILLALLLLAPIASEAQTRLLMIEQAACEWCEAWDAEVGIIYAKTTEGKRAPLIRADIFETLPAGVELSRRARVTPTFILLRDGSELGRIEGYPGEAFFYGMLKRMLDAAAKPGS